MDHEPDLDGLLSRHAPDAPNAPDAPDGPGLAAARARLDSRIAEELLSPRSASEPAALTLAPRARRSDHGWARRLAFPAAAAVALGLAITLWPGAPTPAAFADWTPRPSGEVTASEATALAARCRAEVVRADGEAVVTYETLVGQELEGAAVDTRGSWSLVVFEPRESADSSQLGCLVDATGASTEVEVAREVSTPPVTFTGVTTPEGTYVAWVEEPSLAASPGMSDDPHRDDPDAASLTSAAKLPKDPLLSLHTSEAEDWAQVSGTVAAEVTRAVVTLDGGEPLEATVSDPSLVATVTSADGGALAAQAQPGPRTFAAWWPAPAGTGRAATLTLYSRDGTITEHRIDLASSR